FQFAQRANGSHLHLSIGVPRQLLQIAAEFAQTLAQKTRTLGSRLARLTIGRNFRTTLLARVEHGLANQVGRRNAIDRPARPQVAMETLLQTLQQSETYIALHLIGNQL